MQELMNLLRSARFVSSSLAAVELAQILLLYVAMYVKQQAASQEVGRGRTTYYIHACVPGAVGRARPPVRTLPRRAVPVRRGTHARHLA